MAITDYPSSQTLTIQVYAPDGGGSNFKSYGSASAGNAGVFTFTAKFGLGKSEGGLSASEVFSPYILTNNGAIDESVDIDNPPKAKGYNLFSVAPLNGNGDTAVSGTALPLLGVKITAQEMEVILPADFTPSNDLAGFQILMPVWSTKSTVDEVWMFWDYGSSGSGLQTTFSFFNSQVTPTAQTAQAGATKIDWGDND